MKTILTTLLFTISTLLVIGQNTVIQNNVKELTRSEMWQAATRGKINATIKSTPSVIEVYLDVDSINSNVSDSISLLTTANKFIFVEKAAILYDYTDSSFTNAGTDSINIVGTIGASLTEVVTFRDIISSDADDYDYAAPNVTSMLDKSSTLYLVLPGVYSVGGQKEKIKVQLWYREESY